jgi:hypothetical protein
MSKDDFDDVMKDVAHGVYLLDKGLLEKSKKMCPKLPGIEHMYGISFPMLCVFTEIARDPYAIQRAVGAVHNPEGPYVKIWGPMLERLGFVEDQDDINWDSTFKHIATKQGHQRPMGPENGSCCDTRHTERADGFFYLQDLYNIVHRAVKVKPFGKEVEECFYDFRKRQKKARRLEGTKWYDNEYKRRGGPVWTRNEK